MNDLIPIDRMDDGTLVVETMTIAENTGVQHKNVLGLVRDNLADLEEFGGVAFETRPFATAGGRQRREVAVLNEQQATLLLTYMRNSQPVRRFKKALVKAFYAMAQELQRAVETPEERFALALLDAKALIDQRDRLLEAQEPKVKFVDEFVDAKDSDTFRVAAHKLGIRESELREALLSRGWIYSKPHGRRKDKKTGRIYPVTAYYASSEKKPYFRVVPHYEVHRRPDGTVPHTLCITAAGLLAVARLLGRVPNHPQIAA